jgi:hypothetical protein
MARFESGFFGRSDRVMIAPGTSVRVTTEPRHTVRAELIALGPLEVVLRGLSQPLVGNKLRVAITLPGRYIEFEVEGNVVWQRDQELGVQLDTLSARQAYALSLARQLLQDKAAPASSKRQTA